MTSVISPIFNEMVLGKYYVGIDKPFNVSEHFKVRRNPTPISYVGERFKACFDRKVLSPHYGYSFMGYKLIERVLDKRMIQTIDDVYYEVLPTSLDFVWSCMFDQPYKDSAGYLATDGSANVFHVIDIDPDLPVIVNVFWRETSWSSKFSTGKGWNVRSYSPEQAKVRVWHVGSRIFVGRGEKRTSRLTL